MLNHSASLAISTYVLKALPDKLNIKRHSPNILTHQIWIADVFTHVRYFYLTYPYQPKGKIKNEHPHVGFTLIPDVIIIFK